MQEETGDITIEPGLLALNGVIEAARAGDAGRCFALQPDQLRNMSQSISTNSRVRTRVGVENILQDIEIRLNIPDRAPDEIFAVAGKIAATARRVTGSLQFEDVVSQVVVYSNEQAAGPRTPVSAFEEQQNLLDTAITMDRWETRMDSPRHRLEGTRDERRQASMHSND